VAVTDIARRLRELITALDRRAPRDADTTENVIARDSATLRQQAVNRLAEMAAEPGRTQDESSTPPRSKYPL